MRQINEPLSSTPTGIYCYAKRSLFFVSPMNFHETLLYVTSMLQVYGTLQFKLSTNQHTYSRNNNIITLKDLNECKNYAYRFQSCCVIIIIINKNIINYFRIYLSNTCSLSLCLLYLILDFMSC